MKLQTDRHPTECVRTLQECVRKRPLRLSRFPFRCEPLQVADGRASVRATFHLAEPHGVVTMRCVRQGQMAVVESSTDENTRCRVTAKSMAKDAALLGADVEMTPWGGEPV